MKLSYIFFKKVFVIFRKIELSNPKNKKYHEGTFPAQEKPTFKSFLYFRKWNFLDPHLKNLYIRRNFQRLKNKKFHIFVC